MDDEWVLEVCLAIDRQGGARPADVVTVLAGKEAAARFIRLGLEASMDGGARTNPLDLERLRSVNQTGPSSVETT